MKRPSVYLHILVILLLGLLPACSQSGSSEDRKHCSYEGEVCVNLDIVPSFAAGDPVNLVIIVTSAKDFPDLHLTLSFNSEITMDSVDSWEDNLRNPSITNWACFLEF